MDIHGECGIFSMLYGLFLSSHFQHCCVGAHLSRNTFVLRKTDAVAFVPHETNETSNLYPKKLISVTNVLRSIFWRDKKAHLSHVPLRDKKAHLSHVIF
jgi:hypothetical protein